METLSNLCNNLFPLIPLTKLRQRLFVHLEPGSSMETGWTEEKEVELSPLLFKPRPNQETEKEYSEQGQATSPSQIPTPVGAGLDVDLQVGMFWKMPVLELAMELLDLLTINLVLPPGAAFANPKKWLWAALMAEVLARLWGYWVSPVLVRIAHRRHSAA
jgi:hypothetical protein